jgi:dUTP pyrophosphatase
MLIKFKKLHPDAKLPIQSEGDVGFDLFSCEAVSAIAGRVSKVRTGLVIANYEYNVDLNIRSQTGDGLTVTVYPKVEGRGSLGSKGIFPVAGVIDPIYRGELVVTLANMSGEDYEIKKGDRIAQFVFYTCLTTPFLEFQEVIDIVPTRRGDKGFGSTGR